MKTVLILTFLMSNFLGCDKTQMVEVKGLLEKQGVTTYMYGTHTISNNNIYYALRSETINLDNYIGQNVIIIGEPIEGYPIDSGPEYLDVKEVKLERDSI